MQMVCRCFPVRSPGHSARPRIHKPRAQGVIQWKGNARGLLQPRYAR